MHTNTVRDAAEIIVKAASAQASHAPTRTDQRVHRVLPYCVEMSYAVTDGTVTLSAAGQTVTCTPALRAGVTLTDEELMSAFLRRFSVHLPPTIRAVNDSIDGAGEVTVGTRGTIGLNYGI